MLKGADENIDGDETARFSAMPDILWDRGGEFKDGDWGTRQANEM